MRESLSRRGASPLRHLVWAVLAAMIVPYPGFASTSDFRYDSLGRLRTACNAIPSDGERTDYTLDQSDNRSRYTNTRTDFIMGLGSEIGSGDNRFILRMQTDGNLVLLQRSNQQALWSSNTAGKGATSAYFQGDGNLVIYTSNGSVWHSATYNSPCAQIYVQNDGNTVIKNIDGNIVWQTNTGGR